MMKLVLEQLAAHPGVRLVALVMEDGVPVHVYGNGPSSDGAGGEEGERTSSVDLSRESNALAALSAGWVHEVMGAIGPLSWEQPARMALRCARGTLVLRRAHNAWLLVLLAGGLRTEDVLLAMDGTAARVERLVRGMSGSKGTGRAPEPPAVLPGVPEADQQPSAAEPTLFNADQESPEGR